MGYCLSKGAECANKGILFIFSSEFWNQRRHLKPSLLIIWTLIKVWNEGFDYRWCEKASPRKLWASPARWTATIRYNILCHKGTVSRDFLLLVFFLNQFPPSLWLYHRAISNFFENSWRYSQLKVCHRCQRHRWQMEKTFKHHWVVELTYTVYKFLPSSSL